MLKLMSSTALANMKTHFDIHDWMVRPSLGSPNHYPIGVEDVNEALKRRRQCAVYIFEPPKKLLKPVRPFLFSVNICISTNV
ncbi:hypothetical protein KIN20_007123 [Parelaphostrongylus tenuis]|uniref:Uncharacterized protein n=1 Tax=Parelaphostrongylus tenuis TaxID=148309 RepID=A0AAD5MV46_PARTN|nr:hypothetical protein KIN20_007123 [Parelaphostrongylus tenuis]